MPKLRRDQLNVSDNKRTARQQGSQESDTLRAAGRQVGGDNGNGKHAPRDMSIIGLNGDN
jgi:hypothetical protein